MKKYQLGEFEEIVMLTVGILYKDAYGVSIKKEIEERLARNVSVGALQAALQRLEQKGYLKSHEGEATQERAGRPKRYFTITAYGRKAIEHTKSTRDELWAAIPKVALHLKFTAWAWNSFRCRRGWCAASSAGSATRSCSIPSRGTCWSCTRSVWCIWVNEGRM